MRKPPSLASVKAGLTSVGAITVVDGDGIIQHSTRPRLDHLRVLVADDDPEARVLFTTILERAGATVTPAASAEEALTALRCASHDVLVSDIAMPGADGYGLLREALAVVEERQERLMAVAVTAHGRPDDEAGFDAAGVDRRVHKPVDPQTLVAAVPSVHDQVLHA